MSKVDVQRKMPSDRFNVDAFYHPNGEKKGSVSLTGAILFSVSVYLMQGD
jgi:hypothetical protein